MLLVEKSESELCTIDFDKQVNASYKWEKSDYFLNTNINDSNVSLHQAVSDLLVNVIG